MGVRMDLVESLLSTKEFGKQARDHRLIARDVGRSNPQKLVVALVDLDLVMTGRTPKSPCA